MILIKGNSLNLFNGLFKNRIRKSRLEVIVPYRDRELHMQQFVPYIESYLLKNKIIFSITIVEQCNNKPFNRGALLNIGFILSLHADYFCFHDIDMLPLSADYSHPKNPAHLASKVEQFNWQLPYPSFFGGVTLFTKKHFKKINGFPNTYWGWGSEDDELWERCRYKKVKADRRDGVFSSLQHNRDLDSDLYNSNLRRFRTFRSRAAEAIKNDGVSSLRYQLISKTMLSKHTRILQVDFN
jgi:hypothetical protein